MLTTAMTAQISAMRTTWAVLIERVLVIRDAWNDPRSSTALGATPLAGQACSVTAVAPTPSPTEPRPMVTFAQAARPQMSRCASLASTCLSTSELILSTSPSATAPSYAWPSSLCAAAAAVISCRASSSMRPSYIAIDRPDNGSRHLTARRGAATADDQPGFQDRVRDARDAALEPVDGSADRRLRQHLCFLADRGQVDGGQLRDRRVVVAGDRAVARYPQSRPGERVDDTQGAVVVERAYGRGELRVP